MNYTLDQYRQALRNFDWTHEFSDDARVYLEGRITLRKLHAMQAQLDPTGAIWREMAPAGNVPQPVVLEAA